MVYVWLARTLVFKPFSFVKFVVHQVATDVSTSPEKSLDRSSITNLPIASSYFLPTSMPMSKVNFLLIDFEKSYKYRNESASWQSADVKDMRQLSSPGGLRTRQTIQEIPQTTNSLLNLISPRTSDCGLTSSLNKWRTLRVPGTHFCRLCT